MSKRAEEIVDRLTTDDKIALLSGADFWHTASVDGVKAIAMSDGPHGLRKQESDGADNPGINTAVKATCFPNAVNLASSFDVELARELGETLGAECRALGVDVLLGPGVNIKRSPLCGRSFEYLSEDPYLSGVMAASLINGVQSTGTGVSVKHFACNNQELRRNVVSATIDERTLREIYLSAFEYVVKNSNPRTVMCAYNKINGVYCSENKYLLTDILRREWGFNGMVVSDWGAVVNRSNALRAGLDLEMPPNSSLSDRLIKDSLKDGSLDEKYIDESAARVIDTAIKAEEAIADGRNYIYDRAKDHEIARRAARESMALLKNDGILPLKQGKKIVFVGEFAEKPRYQGGGSSHVNTDSVTTPIEIARQKYGVEYVKGFDIASVSDGDDLLVEAIEKAGKADAAVVFLGLPERLESEGYDRRNIDLPYNQTALIRELKKVQENIAVVLFNGAPVAMPWLGEASAVLEAYLPGEAAGEAVCDLLFGEYSPCGKLAESFPIALEDNPSHNYFPGGRLSVEYREGVYVGYRYYDKTNKPVLFPFGHGLSYSEFKYSDFKLNRTKIGINDKASVSITVTNAGDYTAKEIVQIYVSAPHSSSVFMPAKALAAFTKIELKPKESRTLEIEIPERAFQYYNTDVKRYVTLGGEYKALAAASSRDIRAEAVIEVAGENVPSPYDSEKLKSYFSGNIQCVGDDEYRNLYGKELPQNEFSDKKRVFTIYDTLNDAKNTTWGKRIMNIIAYKSREKADKSMGESDIYLESIGNTPLAVIPGLSGGVVSIDTMYDLLNLFNNKKALISLFKLLKAGVKILRAVK